MIWISMGQAVSQDIIPLDTAHWEFTGNYILEDFKGKKAVYSQGGTIRLKNSSFLNGTIEFDMFLKEEQMFPGVYFRAQTFDGEQWFVRPHLSGKPDANQAAPIINGITPWQLYFGPKYSFPYQYKFDEWTHVKLVVNDNKAQVYLDHADKPNHSWQLFLEPKAGDIIIRGGRFTGMHIADVKIYDQDHLANFKPVNRDAILNLIQEWQISDMFEEKALANPNQIPTLIKNRKWNNSIIIEEGTAGNIARVHNLYEGKPGNTVFARITIDSNKDQLKLFEFGYSDRVVAILNGKPIYWGTNKWRSRDYRYLGTIGLFDGIYLDLKKGKNELLMAVSEDFGGWLITGRFQDPSGMKVNK